MVCPISTRGGEGEAKREEKSWSRAAQVLTASVDGKGVFDSPDGSERALVVDVAGLLQAVTVSPPVQQSCNGQSLSATNGLPSGATNVRP